MHYTIGQLAELSGLTIRTLRYYDAIESLKPAYVGDNGYRYYNEDQLLTLQQILFFRELGFELKIIKTILQQPDFNLIATLQSQKVVLSTTIARTTELVKTIEKTIDHLERKITMENKELFYGFDAKKQNEYEDFIAKTYGDSEESLPAESKRRTAQWDAQEWNRVKKEIDAIHKALVESMDQGLEPTSDEMQAIIHRHYTMIACFYTPSKEVYIGLSQMYATHPDFKKFFDAYHPEMIDFIGQAMNFFADTNL